MGIIEFVLAGLGVGIAIGMTGVGGGSLMTPLLIMGFGLPPSTAIGTDLLYAACTKSFGAFLHGRARSVHWPTVGLMAMGSVPASLGMIAWLHTNGITPWVEHLMTITLCIAIFATAVVSLLRTRLMGNRSIGAEAVATAPIDGPARAVITVVAGLALGALVTLSSVGAGVLGTTLLLLLYPRLSMFRVVGTDISHAVPLTLVAGLGHVELGSAELATLGFLLIGSLPGIYIGTQLALRVRDQLLRGLVAILLLAAGGGMLWHTLSAFGLVA
ncbi:sulfite exporter TauE/SafE family protein [Salinisphaera sp. USBA-960]|uniref:sulfite exporter TauE/SafE family protein n=1 Tax=Salinisphaera orenii TaxID=856731 RepID=UPI00147466FC|nr:sulfite exporter TauE/SafE family protein [Salifodinibacter halophilus]NNC25848.1 sulfite exporter TauE/SafE family protein [Salifodinibacter halophilus]